MSAIIYDLIPFIMPERYLTDHGHARRFYRNLERLRRYDLLLAISESTKRDAERLLGLRTGQVLNIGSACDQTIFRAEPREPRDQLKAPESSIPSSFACRARTSGKTGAA